jgi:hypothetical protein
MTGLTALREQAGDPAVAEAFYRRARVSGDPPSAGDPTVAATGFEQLLDDDPWVLGPDHPEALATHASLVCWQREANNARNAP